MTDVTKNSDSARPPDGGEQPDVAGGARGDEETIPVFQNILSTLGRRGVELFVLLLGVSTLLFFLLRLTGDPAAVLAGETGDAEQLALIRAQYGLDKPIIIQYLLFLSRVAVFDFGS